MKISPSFYRQEDVIKLASDLLGKVLCTSMHGVLTKGIILETEAYNGIHDKACHAYQGKRTQRTEIMFHEGGKAYVYLCYGIHHLFNIVTGEENTPTAILIRAIEPLEGVEEMLSRRAKQTLKNLTGGPGTLSQALGIHSSHSGISLSENEIWLEDHGIHVPENEIEITPRIGIAYAQEDALLPYRFLWKKGQK